MSSPTEDADLAVDVLVVGAGPVGMAMARMLTRHGCRVILVDATASLSDFPRAVSLDGDVARLLDDLGLGDVLVGNTVSKQVMKLIGARGQLLMSNDPTARPHGWAQKLAFLQPAVDTALRELLRNDPMCSLALEHRFVSFAEDENGVSAHTEGGDGAAVHFRARYLIGCDGRHSRVREAAGFGFSPAWESETWLIVDIVGDPIGVPDIHLFANGVRPAVCISLPRGHRRLEFLLPEADADRNLDSSTALSIVQEHFPEVEGRHLLRFNVTRHGTAVADTFRRSRVLLAGDAAHLMPVWLGQGYNSGLRDAQNLAWKVALVARGVAHHGLLDTYEVERRTQIIQTARMAGRFGRLFTVRGKLAAWARDTTLLTIGMMPPARRYLVEMRFKPATAISEGALLRDSGSKLKRGRAIDDLRRMKARRQAVVGSVLPQFAISRGSGHNEHIDHFIGPSWALLSWGVHACGVFDDRDAESLKMLPARLVPIMPHLGEVRAGSEQDCGCYEASDDAEGSLKTYFSSAGAGMILVRPDRIVAAACLVSDGPRVLRDLLKTISVTATAD